MKIQTLPCLVIALLAIAGCQTEPTNLVHLRDDLIEDGKTTLKELKEHLGPPALGKHEPDGNRASYYMDSSGEPSAQGKLMHGLSEEPGTVRFKAMSILSNKEGIVTDHWEYQSSHPVKARALEGGPRFHYGPGLDPVAVSRIRHGETGEKDLVGWFGVPTLEFLTPERTLIFVWIEGSVASSISRHATYRALSVALDDRSTVTQHSVMETEKLSEAMIGLVLR